MKPFSYERAATAADAVRKAGGIDGARFVAGGTNLLDLMKLQVETPSHLVDLITAYLDPRIMMKLRSG